MSALPVSALELPDQAGRLTVADRGLWQPNAPERFATVPVEPPPAFHDDPVLRANPWPSNSEMIVDLVRLSYLARGRLTMDPTFGKGNWWNLWWPELLAGSDLDPVKSPTGTSVAFTNLPYEDGLFEAATYDPPYVCVDEETEILTADGWRKWDQVLVGQLAYGLDHETGEGTWAPIEDVIVLPAKDREVLSLEGQSHSSLTTLDHRWPILRRRRSGENRRYEREFTTSRDLKADDRVPLAARCRDLPTEATHSDAFVEVVAWFWTEGHLERGRRGEQLSYGKISQSHVVNGPNCERIRCALAAEFGPDNGPFPRTGLGPSDGKPRWREAESDHKAEFWFNSDLGHLLRAVAPNRVPTREFIRGLTSSQLDLFIEVSMLADGCETTGGARSLAQKDPAAAEAFQFACTLAGIATSIRPKNGHMTNVRLRGQATFRPSRNTPTLTRHQGIVWCVTTPTSTWLARRHGSVFFTGNCPGGRKTSGVQAWMDAYGLTRAPKSPAELQELIDRGLAEVARCCAPKAYLLVKCQSYISSGKFWPGVRRTLDAADKLGLRQIDQFEHVAGTGAQPLTQKDGSPRRQVHSRANHSTLLVLQVPPRRRRRRLEAVAA